MRGLLLCLALVAATLGCRDDGERPVWLGAKIEAIGAEPVTNPPTRLYRFRYNDDVVYYRPPRCCDQFGELYDAAGGIVCYPDGGITGRGDGRCADFATTRSDCRLIWSDPRGKGAGAGLCDRPQRAGNPTH